MTIDVTEDVAAYLQSRGDVSAAVTAVIEALLREPHPSAAEDDTGDLGRSTTGSGG